MPLIDFILNLAGLLLWLGWRAVRFDPLARAGSTTPVGTVRRTELPRMKRWHFLAAIAGLLFTRAIFYRMIGRELNWTPGLDLAFVILSFRVDRFGPVLLYSVLSFVLVLVVYHFWLLFLAVVNRRAADPDPYQKMIALQLGRVARWPWPVQLILPVAAIFLLWLALHPLLVWAGVVNPARSLAALSEQGLLLGAGVYLSLKYLLPAILLVHLIASYVYLGSSPLWDFIRTTSQRLLAPLQRVPLRVGKVDFAPLAGIVLILLLLHAGPNAVLSEVNRRNLTVWPQ
jgi:uncharacterized protein YggT (Ycf19 family)